MDTVDGFEYADLKIAKNMLKLYRSKYQYCKHRIVLIKQEMEILDD